MPFGRNATKAACARRLRATREANVLRGHALRLARRRGSTSLCCHPGYGHPTSSCQPNSVPCYAAPFHIIPHHHLPNPALPWHGMPCPALPCHFWLSMPFPPRHTLPLYAPPCCVLLCCTMPCLAMSCHAMPRHTMPCPAIASPCHMKATMRKLRRCMVLATVIAALAVRACHAMVPMLCHAHAAVHVVRRLPYLPRAGAAAACTAAAASAAAACAAAAAVTPQWQ
eukprot:364726-Chlamydomonas_euryale.AAC.7